MMPVSSTVENATLFLNTLCSLDADEIQSHLSDDARLCVRSRVFAEGKSRIIKALKRSIASINALHYQPAAVWTQANVSVIEADVSCERLDGSLAVFPVTLILCFRDRLISDIPLFTYEPAVPGSFLQ